jgi:hypothetical protein
VGAHHKADMNITDKLIRLSVGVEHYEDIIWDIGQALDDVDPLAQISTQPGNFAAKPTISCAAGSVSQSSFVNLTIP